MTVIALYYLITKYESRWWLFWVGFGCAIRPTNALVWFPIIVVYMLQRPLRLLTHVIPMTYVLQMICLYFLPSMGWLMLSIAIDSWFYGKLVFVIWNFVKFNFIQNLSHCMKLQMVLVLIFSIWRATMALVFFSRTSCNGCYASVANHYCIVLE